MPKPSKIVVARYRFIGDTLLTIPFLRALRQQHPEAEIHLLVGEDAYDLVADCPYINRAIPFEPRKLGFWKAVRLIRDERYDTAYLLKRSFSSAMMTALAGVPQRIGFNTDHRGLLLTTRIPYRPTEQHEAACFLDLLPRSPETPPDLRLETWISEATFQKLASFFHFGEGPRIVLHITSTNPAKCWPLRHFTALAENLIGQYHAQLYFLGPAPERPQYDALIQHLGDTHAASLHNLCGNTSLVESMALLKHMDLVVANDSGMIHMAAAMKTPVVSIFGPSDPSQWYPLSERASIVTHPSLTCRPCRMKITCNHQYPCLTEITPEMVFAACKPYLTS